MIHSIKILTNMFPAFGVFNLTLEKAKLDILIYLNVWDLNFSFINKFLF